MHPPLTVDTLLAQAPWFGSLPPEHRATVRAEVREQHVAQGDCLVRQGHDPLYWYGTLSGLLKWSAHSRDGRAVTFGGLTPGSWFGEGTLMKGEPRASDVVALRDSRVACLPKDLFQWLYLNHLPFCHFLLEHLNARLHLFMDSYWVQRTLGADAQVARALASLFHPVLHPGAARQVALGQEDIAQFTGVSRQRCNEALSRLRALGLVNTEYGQVTVLDLDGLRRFGE